jgi:2-keto-4-pentenoate hydratase/2-oxohepta-3-ene-1,7-dioic acid hydratase in catechol pathway
MLFSFHPFRGLIDVPGVRTGDARCRGAGAHGLRIQGRLNGLLMQDARTDQLIFSVPELIVIISVAMSLEPVHPRWFL